MFKKNNLSAFKMLVITTGIFLSACIERTVPVETDKNYFDLKDFFEKEALFLNGQIVTVEKYLISEKDTQKLILSDVSWEKELAPFINKDINKPAWKGSYEIDSIMIGEKLNLITYKALEKILPVKEIQIHFEKDNISHIYIESITKNYFYNSAQILSYYVEKGFSIEGEQDIVMGKDLHYKIIINIIK